MVFLKFAYFLNIPFSKIYRKITKISLRAHIFQRPFFGGLYSEALAYGGNFAFQSRLGLFLEGNLRLKIDWASLYLKGNLFVSVICRKFFLKLALRTSQAAQAHYVWVRASEVIWLEYTRIISVLSDVK